MPSLQCIFCFQKMFYVAYRTLLVMFCVLKHYFVDFNGMFSSFQAKAAKFGSLKMHVLCKVGKNIIFQNKTFLVMFYRQNKTFWYQFWNFKHFLKAENSEDSFASSWHSKRMEWSLLSLYLSWVTVGTNLKVSLNKLQDKSTKYLTTHALK